MTAMLRAPVANTFLKSVYFTCCTELNMYFTNPCEGPKTSAVRFVNLEPNKKFQNENGLCK